ncbi:MAG: DNA repair protein RadA [Actinomycetales bacterium]
MKSPSAARSSGSRSSSYRCVECGWAGPKWVGRCSQCQSWGTVELAQAPAGSRTTVAAPPAPATPIGQIDASVVRGRPTGLGEFDRVLGGGLVPGAVLLLTGEPGVGKSTLLLEVAARVARSGRRVLYLTGEESAAQVRLRADRTDCLHEELLLAAENDLSQALGHIEASRPALVILDSVQTVSSDAVEGAAGNVSQVREVAGALVRVAKQHHVTVILVGHVTKEGSLAGPRTLEHAVDVVAHVEGDRHGRLRLLRSAKNRFGPTDEVGCFEMVSDGLREVRDPNTLFTSRQDLRAPGSCVTVALEGRRPMLVEVQSLAAQAAGGGQPRRVINGLDSTRAAIVTAVLSNRMRLPLAHLDIFMATVGGAVLREPAADLAMVLSLASAATENPIPAGLVAFGELGLSGEVRPVSGLARRAAEAARLGFTKAVVPRGCLDPHEVPPGLAIAEAGQIGEVLAAGLPAIAPIHSGGDGLAHRRVAAQHPRNGGPGHRPA